MIQVLDHGYVTLIEGWGSDERIIEAARMGADVAVLHGTILMRRANLSDAARASFFS